jgi:Pacifastin inhibitor (LCMII)
MDTRRLVLVVVTVAALAACNSTDSLLSVHDGAVALDGRSAGAGGAGGKGGAGGATAGSGGMGGGGLGGVSGKGGGSAGSSGGAGGGGVDAAIDSPRDVSAGDAPVVASDGGDVCGAGYPVGSSKLYSDGCNMCYCQADGSWLCTVHQCPNRDAAPDLVDDAGRCPAGQTWCPGCTAGSGSCSVVCQAAPCPLYPDGGCTGSACPTDASASKDGASVDAGTCSQLTTQADCEARSDCHAVFMDLQTCGCASAGCCIHFNRCADGGKAICTAPSTFGCTIATIACGGLYVTSYTAVCYEGCVLQSECGS